MKKTIRVLASIIAMCIISFNTKAQALCPGVTYFDVCGTCANIVMPPTIFDCYPNPVTLGTITVPPWMTVNSWSLTSGGSVWSSGSGPTIPSPMIISPWNFTGVVPPCGQVIYPCNLTVNAYGPDLVYNSDFISPPAPPFGYCTQAGFAWPSTTLAGPPTETVINSADAATLSGMTAPYSWTCSPFLAMPGTNMLFCNLDANVDIIWQQHVWNFCPGELYDIGYYQADLWGDCSGPFPVYSPIPTYLWIWPSTYPAPIGPFPGGGGGAWDVWGPRNLTTWLCPAGVFDGTLYITAAPTPPPFIFSNIPWGSTLALDHITMNRTCTVSATSVVTVDYVSISGPKTCCVGDIVHLVACPGGTWVSTVPSVGTVNIFGDFTALSPGTTTIIYTDPFGCTATLTITVYPNPVIYGGPNDICLGSTLGPLVGAPGSGTWSWDPIVNLTGPGLIWTGVAVGTGNITYTLPTGCYATFPVSVDPVPDPMDDIFLCVGDVEALVDLPAGGTWTCSPATVATITTGGVITAVGPGVATVTYTLGICSITFNAYVNVCPGGSGGYLCLGSGTTLVGSPSGGTWTSSDYSVAPITAGGVITTIPGSITVPTMETFYYTVSGTVVMTVTILIQPPVTACVTTIIIGGPSYYAFDFTSTCTGVCYIKFDVYDYAGNQLPCIAGTGCRDWTTPGIVPYSTIATWYGGAAYSVCVDSVWCNGCWWPADCCAKVNPGPKSSHGVTNGAPPVVEPLKIIPNPNNGTFTVAGEIPNSVTSKDARIEVVNMLGQVVYSDVSPVYYGAISKTINLDNNISNGVYLLRVKADDGGQVIRFTLDR